MGPELALERKNDRAGLLLIRPVARRDGKTAIWVRTDIAELDACQ